MKPSRMAQALGRRGGRARARRLSAEKRRSIASAGGHARKRSLEAARRIVDNFRYVEAVVALQGGGREVARMRTCKGPLPGIYPRKP